MVSTQRCICMVSSADLPDVREHPVTINFCAFTRVSRHLKYWFLYIVDPLASPSLCQCRRRRVTDKAACCCTCCCCNCQRPGPPITTVDSSVVEHEHHHRQLVAHSAAACMHGAGSHLLALMDPRARVCTHRYTYLYTSMCCWQRKP